MFKECHNNKGDFENKSNIKVHKKENVSGSNGWLEIFKKSKLLCGEQSNDYMKTVEIEISKINNEIMNYNPNDVYYVDETEVEVVVMIINN